MTAQTLPREDWLTVGVFPAPAEKVRGSRRLGPNMARFVDYFLDVVMMQDCTHLVLSA